MITVFEVLEVQVVERTRSEVGVVIARTTDPIEAEELVRAIPEKRYIERVEVP